MGASVSACLCNDDMVNVMFGKGFRSPLERAFRWVDRGNYLPDSIYPEAYSISPVRWEQIHVSSPQIYVEMLLSLNVEPNSRFLCIGSGTGYLNSIVGFSVDCYGCNVGLEIRKSLVEHARRCTRAMLDRATAIQLNPFQPCQFIHGDIATVDQLFHPGQFDRILICFSVTSFQLAKVIPLLSDKGVAVYPSDNKLRKFTQIGGKAVEAVISSTVSFEKAFDAQDLDIDEAPPAEPGSRGPIFFLAVPTLLSIALSRCRSMITQVAREAVAIYDYPRRLCSRCQSGQYHFVTGRHYFGFEYSFPAPCIEMPEDNQFCCETMFEAYNASVVGKMVDALPIPKAAKRMLLFKDPVVA